MGGYWTSERLVQASAWKDVSDVPGAPPRSPSPVRHLPQAAAVMAANGLPRALVQQVVLSQQETLPWETARRLRPPSYAPALGTALG